MAHGALKTTGTTRANGYCGDQDESACARFISCIHPTHHFAVGSRWSVQRGLSGPFFTVDSRWGCFDAGR